MDNNELQKLVEEISLQWFYKPFVDRAVFNPRLRTTGGRYIPQYRVIEINPKYVKELGLEEVKGIIKHELCHYHLHIEGKGYQHRDADFKELLRITKSPRFCEPLPSDQKRQHYIYQCKGCSLKFKRQRKVNVEKYRCGSCKGRLKKLKENVDEIT